MLFTGSMQGESIKATQAALLVILKSLPPGCYFNIVGFGSRFALLFPEYDLRFAKFWQIMERFTLNKYRLHLCC